MISCPISPSYDGFLWTWWFLNSGQISQQVNNADRYYRFLIKFHNFKEVIIEQWINTTVSKKYRSDDQHRAFTEDVLDEDPAEMLPKRRWAGWLVLGFLFRKLHKHFHHVINFNLLATGKINKMNDINHTLRSRFGCHHVLVFVIELPISISLCGN